jgi:hypothetical protein
VIDLRRLWTLRVREAITLVGVDYVTSPVAQRSWRVSAGALWFQQQLADLYFLPKRNGPV